MTAPSRPAHERRRAQRIPVSVDCRFNGVDYRLAEHLRDRSAVRPMERDAVPCTGCDRVIRTYSSYLQTPTLNVHPACAIRSGLLVPVGKSFETEAPR